MNNNTNVNQDTLIETDVLEIVPLKKSSKIGLLKDDNKYISGNYIAKLHNDLIVSYLTNDRLAIVIRIESLFEFGGSEYRLNPFVQLDTRLYPGRDPGVGFSLVYKYSVTQSLLWDYNSVKCWEGGTISRARTRRNYESGNTPVAPISAKPVFPDFLYFWFPNFLTVFRQRGTKNKGYACISPRYSLV